MPPLLLPPALALLLLSLLLAGALLIIALLLPVSLAAALLDDELEEELDELLDELDDDAGVLLLLPHAVTTSAPAIIRPSAAEVFNRMNFPFLGDHRPDGQQSSFQSQG